MRENIRAIDIANTVRLKRTYGATRAFLLVEGDDDSAFFRRHVDHGTCTIQVAYGKDNVLGAILILDRGGFRGALGVVDADFWILDGEATPSANVVVTDLHDMECLLLSSPALGHVLSELGEPSRIALFCETRQVRVVEHLVRICTPIGYIRWKSMREGWKLKFDGLNFGRFVNEKTLDLDEDALVEEIRGHQGGREGPPPTLEEIQSLIPNPTQRTEDPWQVCSGHDVVEVLSIGLRRVFGMQNKGEVRRERLESMIRLSYEAAYFRATELHKAIVRWEQGNSPFRVVEV